MKLLTLGEKEIASLISMKEAIHAVEEACMSYAKGQIQMPSKLYLHFKAGDLRIMPAYWPLKKRACVKVVNSHPNNSRVHLPAVMAVTLLSDPDTGAPLALISSTALTDIRTGAAGAVAARHLARKEATTVGLIGCGRQAKTQLSGLLALFPIKTVRVAGKSHKEARQFCAEQRQNDDIVFVPEKEIAQVCAVDIVVTTTPSKIPLVRSEWIQPGTHINAIGADAPGKQELDPKILKKALIVVDDVNQAAHSGEINVPLSRGMIDPGAIHASLGEIVTGQKPGRGDDKQITLFDSTGLAILDLAVANLVYQKALWKKIGSFISLE